MVYHGIVVAGAWPGSYPAGLDLGLRLNHINYRRLTMSEKKVLLEKIHITNFLSLRDVTLPLKPLTVLVGPNASGKSNVLSAINLLGRMMVAEDLPSTNYIQNLTWAGVRTEVATDIEENIGFDINISVEGKPVIYKLVLGARTKNRILQEKLVVGTEKVEVISIKNGEGHVRDENNANPTSYRSKKLALKSAGDYGNKPITSILTNFIQGWEFYDFQPNDIRRGNILSKIMEDLIPIKNLETELGLDDDGSNLKFILSYWHEHDPDRFQAVNDELHNCTRLGLEKNEDNVYLQEGAETGFPYDEIPLDRASDGTLRLMAYYVLLNQAEAPSLITIEEPERNLHPAALNNIAHVLEQLAERTQVIITTHSSQLLDAFSSESLSKNLGILLLQNLPGKGTQVINLDQTRKNREALDGWMEDFGIGSAIFDSELLQDLMAR